MKTVQKKFPGTVCVDYFLLLPSAVGKQHAGPTWRRTGSAPPLHAATICLPPFRLSVTKVEQGTDRKVLAHNVNSLQPPVTFFRQLISGSLCPRRSELTLPRHRRQRPPFPPPPPFRSPFSPLVPHAPFDVTQLGSWLVSTPGISATQVASRSDHCVLVLCRFILLWSFFFFFF